MKKYTSEEIKNRLSNIGAAIGTISLEYIAELEKENKQLKAQIEKMKNCWNCKYYNVGDTTCLKGKPHNSGGCFKDWELKE